MRKLTALFAALISVCCAHAAATKPNIIVILVDDMGYSDIGCYGSEIPTPNLDKLAGEGLRFTQFYNTGRCCPTRASLLTGLYSHQVGVGGMMENRGVPGYLGHLNNQCVTLAEVLKPTGYFTAMSGKWHVGLEQGVTPWGRGFDRSINSPAGGFYYDDSPRTDIYLNGAHIGRRGNGVPDQWYSTDLWTDFGIKFVNEAIATNKPFFLYLAYNAPHFPLQAPQDEIAKFRGKYKIGWDKLREQRHAKQLELGLLDKSWDLSSRPTEVKAWNSLPADQQDRFDNMMAIYAACVSHMDTAVGRLIANLKDRGVLDNTLIFFMSDNGGTAEGGPDGRFSGEHPGDSLSDVYCGQSWATLENTPFRRYKQFNHEGGISTPLIVHWPAGIKEGGEFRRQQGHLIDVMPTCLDVTGAQYPKEFNGNKILPMEGRSLLPAFENKPIERDALYWEHMGNAAVRVGDWKLVRAGRNSAWELYDMAKDRTELHNLSAEQPDRAKALATKWDDWAVRANVVPTSAPGRQSGKKKK